MKDWTKQQHFSMEDLMQIVTLLRDPEHGCPWDKVQTHQSIRKNFIEETYEAVEAIDKADSALLCEELGDVLLQVALHTEMERENGTFTPEDVYNGICRKLISRHSHIFGDAKAATPEQALENWEIQKRAEKHRDTAKDDLESVPPCLPALMRSRKVAKRAAAHGFSKTDTAEAVANLEQRLAVLKQAAAANEPEAQKKALGELLFSAADVSRFFDCDAEEALSEATERFIEKIRTAEQNAGKNG